MAGYDDVTEARLTADAQAIIARYPLARSALLPMLHLVQSEDGYVSPRGIAFCARMLDLTTAEVSAVATFYTQYKRHPNGEYTVGVCTNTLCAVMGGDAIWEELSGHLGIGHDETTPDGTVTLERIECNAACDYAPVMMVNWEFFDNQTPASAVGTVDRLRAGQPVTPTRGAETVCSFRQMSRVLAGFPDGRADEGVGAGPATVRGTLLARERGWTAPEFTVAADAGPPSDGTPAAGEPQSSAERPPTTPADTAPGPSGELSGGAEPAATGTSDTAEPAGAQGTSGGAEPAGATEPNNPAEPAGGAEPAGTKGAPGGTSSATKRSPRSGRAASSKRTSPPKES